jgi:hypothetical protein
MKKKEEQNLLHRHYKPNKPTKKGPLSFVLFESPFTTDSTVSGGGPPLWRALCIREPHEAHAYSEKFLIPNIYM